MTRQRRSHEMKETVNEIEPKNAPIVPDDSEEPGDVDEGEVSAKSDESRVTLGPIPPQLITPPTRPTSPLDVYIA